MKKILSLIIFAALATGARAEVVFTISDGVADQALCKRMQTSVSNLLTAINNACQSNSDINFTGVNITDDATHSLCMTWEGVHFSTEDNDIVDHCFMMRNASGGVRAYQLRNIGVNMTPIDDSYDGESRQEICVDFSPSGKITDINFAMSNSEYLTVMRDGTRLGDTENRLQIISWCEKLKNAYNQKDMSFMEAIFSDDALIITGKVIKERRHSDVQIANPQRVEYVKQNKKEYLANLRKVFDRQSHNGYINVLFDDYRVVRHPSKPNYYGVTLTQKWHSRGYSDEGILFLIWDFNNPDEPQIHVRTWQPSIDTAFTLGDFKLPEAGSSFKLDR